VVFKFSGDAADQTLKLKDGSVLSGEVTVENGTVNATEATLDGVTGIVLNSGLSLTASALSDLVERGATIASNSKSGSQIDVMLTNDADVEAYKALVENGGVNVEGTGGESLRLGSAVSELFDGDPEKATNVAITPLDVTVDGQVVEPDRVVEQSDSIQTAIDSADEGDTIRIAAGNYDETLNISKSVDLIGYGDVTIAPTGTEGIAVTVSGSGDVSFDNIDLDGGQGTQTTASDTNGSVLLPHTGIKVANDATLNSLTFENGSISNFDDYGLVQIVDSSYPSSSATPGIATLTLENTTFVDNANAAQTATNANTLDAQIKLFGFTGSLNVGSTEISTSEGFVAERGIEIVGKTEGGGQSDSQPFPSANLNFDQFDLNGTYTKSPFSVYRFDSIDSSDGSDGLSITGGDFSQASSERGWALLFLSSINKGDVDASALDIAFPDSLGASATAPGPALVWLDGRSGSSDALTITGADATNTSGTFYSSVTGGSGDDTLNAGDGPTFIFGDAGSDTITGGAGDDTFVFNAGDEGDTINNFVVGDDDFDIDNTDGNLVQDGAGDGTVDIDTVNIIDTAADITVANGIQIVDNGDADIANADSLSVADIADRLNDTGDADNGDGTDNIVSFANAGDEILFAISDGIDTAIVEADAAGGDTVIDAAELTVLITLAGIGDAGTLSAGNFDGFT
jgi:hypothetical protein